MTETSRRGADGGTRTDDLAVIALVTYGAVFWGLGQFIDRFTPAGGETLLVVLGLFGTLIAWGLTLIGLVQRRTWAWHGTLLLGGLTTIAFVLGDTPVPAILVGGSMLYVSSKDDRVRAGETPSYTCRQNE